MKFYIRGLSLMLLIVMVFACAGCSQEAKNEEVLSITVSPTEASLDHLESYPNLQTADLRGYTNYEEIMAYIAAHPEVEVTYEVLVGDQVVSGDVTELSFSPGADVFASLMENLKYLPKVSKVSLPETALNLEQLDQLRTNYPDASFDYTVSLLGNVYDPSVTSLDLSAVTPEQLDQVIPVLELLPALTDVELMNAEGTSLLGLTDVAKLQDAQPNAFFNYVFDLYGKTVSTSDEVVEYDEVAIGNEGEQTIRQALDILDNCTYFKLDDCGIDNEIMASIREDYPDTKVVWRVRIPPYSMLTDETMLRLTHHLENDMIGDLKYLNDVTYLDVGHNPHLTDMSFVQYMPKLECVIIAGSNVVDVSHFKHCQNLIWLEMCFCYNIEDISFLENHPTLKYLNISFTAVSDISALKNVELDRFNCMGTRVDYEQQQDFIERNPDCISVWTGQQPFGYGWRYDDYGYTFFSYYANMRKVFRYDDLSYWGSHKE